MTTSTIHQKPSKLEAEALTSVRHVDKGRCYDLAPRYTDSGSVICGPYEFEDSWVAGVNSWDYLWKSKHYLFHSPMSDWAFACMLEFIESTYDLTLISYSIDRCEPRHKDTGEPQLLVEFSCVEDDKHHMEYIGYVDYTNFFIKPELHKTNRCLTLDKERLCMATPDSSMFTTSYPLSEPQANILRTILSNIESVNLKELFTALLPTYLQAKAASKGRQAIITTPLAKRLENAEDLALIDLEELLDLTTEPSLLRSLPTLKECMSEGFNGGGN